MTYLYHVMCDACSLNVDNLAKRQAEQLEREHAIKNGHACKTKKYWDKQEVDRKSK